MASKFIPTLVFAMFAVWASSALASAPTITSFTPASGKLTTTVTITGTGFAAPATVTFNGVAASTVTVNSATSITALVPLTGTTGKIAVTTPGGTVTSTAVFTVIPGVAPSPGFAPPGATDTVSFSGFDAYEAVDFYFDTTDFGLGSATGAGVGNLAVTIPTAANPGTHWITAVGRKSGYSAQVSFTVRTDWMEFGFRPNHRGRNPFENILSTANVDQLEEAWRTPGYFETECSPADVAGVVYQNFGDGTVRAFDEATGTQKWAYTIGAGTSFSSPAVVNGIVYVGSGDSHLYALEATTGALKWRYQAGNSVYSSPVVKGGLVYFGSYDDYVYALNATTGVLVWKYKTGSVVFASPAVWNGLVFACSEDDNVYGLNAATGALVWSYTTGATITASPIVVDGTVYVGSYDGYMYALNALSGFPRWMYQAEYAVEATAAFENGTVYFSVSGAVYALSGATGAVKWTFADTSGYTLNQAACVANGVLYMGNSVNTFVLDAASGELDATLPAGTSYGGPIVANGALIIPDATSLIRYTLNPAASEPPSAAPDPATLRHHPLR